MENFEYVEADLNPCPCLDSGFISLHWVEQREPQCTCGAGDPADPTVLHKVSCDAVPCPFCPLEAELNGPV